MKPCLHCQNRHTACHDTCIKYLLERAVLDKVKALRWQQGEIDDYVRTLIARNL